MNVNPNRAESAIAPNLATTRQVTSTIIQIDTSSGFLEQLQGLVDWPGIARDIPERYQGWPSERVILLKMLYLADCYGLSDLMCATECRDRLSFRRFLGVSVDAELPGREDLTRVRQGTDAYAMEDRLFAKISAQLEAAGATVLRSKTVGATLSLPHAATTPAPPPVRQPKVWVQPKKTHPFSDREQRPASVSTGGSIGVGQGAISNRAAGGVSPQKEVSLEFRTPRTLAQVAEAEKLAEAENAKQRARTPRRPGAKSSLNSGSA